MVKIKNVLFLCTGNSCRSVFAEYYAKWLKQTQYIDKLKDVNFDSAGIRHFFETPREGTLNYLNNLGISLDDFIAKDITNELLLKQDLILGFEHLYHTKKVKRRFKHIDNLNEKVYLLREYAGEDKDWDIKDPINLPIEEYNKILHVIEEGVEKVIKKIIKINEQEDD
ncbi:MAG: arsenate reductase/protein-tyrosine-phosphatase family protein [Promethearchaeota archaeon]